MIYCYDDIHLGHRPIILTMVSGCLWPPHISLRRARYCTHAYHIGFVRRQLAQPVFWPPRGITIVDVRCGRRRTRVRMPYLYATRDDYLRLADALAWVAGVQP